MPEVAQGRRREIRLALVLNGGVSLAVWMGGVVHEIDLLRRASRVACGAEPYDESAVAPYDRPVFRAWAELCERAGAGPVVVDVIAGTSAGGLNGTLLATAVARGVPLDPPSTQAHPYLRRVWNDSARLENERLLRLTRDPCLPSVLDGDYFRDEIDRVVGTIGRDAAEGQASPEPVTLFVTATALGESNRSYVDSFGRGFDVADHRRLYRFRRSEDDRVVYRPGSGPPESWWPGGALGEIDDFDAKDPGAHEALVTAARASASFPLAFAPVEEGPALAARRVLPAATVEREGARWLVDGGVLDNAPFQPVLDAIGRRPATEPVRRLLVYVVPSQGAALDEAAERLPATGEGEVAHPPWRGILGSAVGFPRESDVRADMEYTVYLLGRGELVQGRPEVGPEALFRAEVDAGTPTGLADGLFEQYRRARAVGGLQDVRNVLARARAGGGVVLAPVAGADPAELLRQPVSWVPPDAADLRRRAGPWRWGMGAAERVCRLLVRDLWDRSADHGAVAPITAALVRVEAVRDAVGDRVVATAATAPDGGTALLAWADGIMAELRVTEALTWCTDTAAEAYARARGGSVDPAAVLCAGLAVEVATQALTGHQPFHRTAPFEFLRLGPDVETPLVDCAHAEPAEVRRSSERARHRGDAKLYGTRVQHFAAFGLDEWRGWDWTAGRLDAQVHLARALTGSDPTDWTADVQRHTVHAELGLGADAWRAARERLYTTTDADLVADLCTRGYGAALVVAVTDAVMRALPHRLALDRTGLLANALLARRPQQRLVTWWAPLARFVVRRRWQRWTRTLGVPDGVGAGAGPPR
ncbi:patatin-like phospholipase family protein [Geodermatophilus sp. YIM 151500]|uniref:patatin-like phospholipase family protein n=1 Tax=Geodermatophilus sp. YIM 151500 TaxID=2984531 RepID=UPI0021E3DFE9|nr:patatin-like phospholipase family protein [Geodermatophilus sp. YIM 151500]MCV2490712.1 patatin-like phospholipase family protein [Geodermatophilus sp. YIM 151500]